MATKRNSKSNTRTAKAAAPKKGKKGQSAEAAPEEKASEEAPAEPTYEAIMDRLAEIEPRLREIGTERYAALKASDLAKVNELDIERQRLEAEHRSLSGTKGRMEADLESALNESAMKSVKEAVAKSKLGDVLPVGWVLTIARDEEGNLTVTRGGGAAGRTRASRGSSPVGRSVNGGSYEVFGPRGSMGFAGTPSGAGKLVSGNAERGTLIWKDSLGRAFSDSPEAGEWTRNYKGATYRMVKRS